MRRVRTFYFGFHVSDAYVFGQSPTERGCMRQAACIAGRNSAWPFISGKVAPAIVGAGGGLFMMSRGRASRF
jgi:hypothetical protein